MSKKGFGMIANEPFYLRTKLPSKRVAECLGSNVVLRKYVKGKSAQKWKFDPVAKVIRTLSRTGYGLKIEATNLRCQSLYSKWEQIFRW
jgi:hypothetical protein